MAVAQPLPKIAFTPIFPEYTFQLPVRMEEAPDGSQRFFIVEQDGRIRVLPKPARGAEAKVFLDIADRQPHLSYEQGLLGLAFHPRFKTNGLLYIYYTQHNPWRSVISEFKTAPDDPDRVDLESERILMEVPQPSDVHNGGQISFGPDGMLYIGLGDGGGQNDPFNNGQSVSSVLGAILRIDVNTRSTSGPPANQKVLPYGIPADNPFVREPEFWENSVRKEIWALGFRNPWRFSWDRQTGELWAGDVGQDKWEEINLVVKGGNYGWCVREGAHHFKPGPKNARYLDPVIEYPHDPKLLAESKFPTHGVGACVVGGYVYRGKKYPALRGVYLYADFVAGTIWGMRQRSGKVTAQATLLTQPKNITSFAEDLEGELYALTYDGGVYSITTVPERLAAGSAAGAAKHLGLRRKAPAATTLSDGSRESE